MRGDVELRLVGSLGLSTNNILEVTAVMAPQSPPESLSWIDSQFRQTSMVILILFPFCCGEIALIFGIIGTAICKDPIARTRLGAHAFTQEDQ